jgi:copper transport protein
LRWLKRQGWRLPFFTVALALVAAFAWHDAAPTAEAHATLVRSSPENGSQNARPPAVVQLYFSEAVEPKLTEIHVRDSDNNRVDEGETIVDADDRTIATVDVPTLDPGLYTVEFSNVSSVDGHPWSGVMQFIVLNPDGSVPPGAEFDPEAAAGTGGTGLLPRNIDITLKWIALVALAMSVGSAFFALAVSRPAAKFLDDEDYAAASSAAESWVVTLAHILLPASFIATALLVVLAVSRFQTEISLFDYFTDIRSGRYQLLNLILVAVALVGADILYLAKSLRLRRAGIVTLILAGVGAMLAFSMISHAATGEGKFWSISSDFVHFVTSSLWLGALVLLVPLLRWTRARFGDQPAGFLYLANCFDRFSILAGLSVILVMATGVFNGFVEIPRWSAFVDTTYGRVLLAKLIIVAMVLPVAGLNAFVFKPRLVASIDTLYQDGGTQLQPQRQSASKELSFLQRWLPVTIVAEVVLIVAVFASVGVLTQTSTAKGEIAQEEAADAANTEFTDVQTAGDLQLGITIQPNRVGINRYAMTVRNLDGSPATNVTQARMRFTYVDPAQPDLEQPTAELILRPTTNPGEFEGQGSYFTQVGSWRTVANVRRSGADDVERTWVVPVAPSDTAGAGDEGSAFALPFDTLHWNHVAGAMLALLGLMLIIYRKQFEPLARHAYRIAVTAGAALLIGGAVLWFGVETHAALPDPSAGNPVEASEESIANGKMLFEQNCVVCHGAEGRGDGPQAESLDPKPADLRQHLPYHTDPQFFAFIANGFPGTAMPAWRDDFTDEEIWNIINYLRTFEDVPDQ